MLQDGTFEVTNMRGQLGWNFAALLFNSGYDLGKLFREPQVTAEFQKQLLFGMDAGKREIQLRASEGGLPKQPGKSRRIVPFP